MLYIHGKFTNEKTEIFFSYFRLPYIDETTNERLNTIRSKTSKRYLNKKTEFFYKII
jgi:hypothetical protein